MSYKRSISLFLILLTPLTVLAQPDELAQMNIVSSWGGLGTRKQSELTIQRKSKGYFQDGNRVEEKLILNLMMAINEPVISKPDLGNLGITQEWLEASAEKGLKEYAGGFYLSAAPNQKALYFSSFKNLDFIGKVVPSLFQFFRSDDYPRIQITITDTKGNQSTIVSTSQYLFMLPWKLSRNGQTTEIFNAHISQAIANLLPQKFANRDRILGEELRNDLVEVVMRWLEDDWHLLDTENKAGRFLASLRSKFTVETAEIGGFHNVEYGKEWVNGNSTETNVHVGLRRKDFPSNYFVGAVLPYKNNQVENVDVFMSNIDSYHNLALSVPWLREYMTSHPKISIELRFIRSLSFGEKAMEVFASDMKQMGKEDLVREVAAIQKDISLLRVGRTYYQAHWLVLPDGRMILWRFRGYDALLKWSREDFIRKDCSKYQGECVGAVISKEGLLVTK